MTKFPYKAEPALADVLANIKARQAELAEQERAVKEKLMELGEDVIEGAYARVTISHVPETKITDTKKCEAILKKLGKRIPTKTKSGFVRFAVKARVADASIKEVA